jgi:hypothetical protein
MGVTERAALGRAIYFDIGIRVSILRYRLCGIRADAGSFVET